MKIKFLLLAGLFLITTGLNYVIYPQHDTFLDESILISFLLLGGFGCYLVLMYFIRPVAELRKVTGQFTSNQDTDVSNSDENALQTATALVLKLNHQINSATAFVRQIEKGNLEVTYPGIQSGIEINQEELAGALISLSTQLRHIAASEKERTWTTEGLAKFADTLRMHSHDITTFSDQIITQIVKYLKANQGSLFLYSENPEPALHMISTYAFDRKKYGKKHIGVGQGLLGQAFLEKQYIHLTEIPADYVAITSGLGGATPKSLLIVPLINNDQVLGVFELASFHQFENYQITFLEKLAESIASTLSSVKIAEQTKKLLEESQMQADIMRAQEEEMRQNMEELIATQENQQRLQLELKQNEENLQFKISELEESKKILEQKETELKATVAKSQKKSIQFKEKMEQLDIELECKDSMIHVLKQEKAELQEKLSAFEKK